MASLGIKIKIIFVLVFSITFINLMEAGLILKKNYFLDKQIKKLREELTKNKHFDTRSIWDAYKDFTN